MHIEEIENILLLLPDLIQQHQRRSPDFIPHAVAWLHSLEKAFVANRLYQAGIIAALRSSLIAANQGQIPAGFEFRGRPTRSRVLNAVASQVLQRAAEVASNLVTENQPRLKEAERVAHQIVSAALSRGLISACKEKISHTEYLRMLRHSLGANSELENAFVHLEGLVGPYDALILFDRALSAYLNVTSRAV